MVDLSTRYMGLSLKNPIVISSCGLTKNIDGVKQAADAGAGAIVLKSLFEEQIASEMDELTGHAGSSMHTEALEYLQGYGRVIGPKDYLKLVQEAKKMVDIPIIPSINCVTAERWIEYARQLESSGADGLELNIGYLPNDPKITGDEVDQRYVEILSAVRQCIEIPVALKIGPYFSSLANLAARLGNSRAEGPPFTVGWCGPGQTEQKISWRGADALVLFNRFYRFDINIDTLELAGGNPYSSSEELHLPLRWISLLSGRVDCDLAATTGVHNGKDAIKQILAGATVVQVCSTFYQNGLSQINVILRQIEEWMNNQQFQTIDEFRGQLGQIRSDKPMAYERTQYIRALVGIE
jgi:dihydroorotate dehydrogenase (fumarate)